MDARYIKVTAEELHPEVTMEEASRQAWAEQERRAEEDLPEEAPDWIGEVLMAEEPMTTDPPEGVDRRDLPEPVPERTATDHAEAADLLRQDGLYGAARQELNKGLRKVRTISDVDALLLTARGFFPLLSKRGWFRNELDRFKEIDGRLHYVYLPSYRVGSCRPENLWRIAQF